MCRRTVQRSKRNMYETRRWTPFVKILRNLWTKRDRVTITVRGLPLPPRLQVSEGMDHSR